MGKDRSQRRASRGDINVFPAETSLGWRAIRTVTIVKAVEKMASGEWAEVRDEHGNFLGCQVLANFKKDEDLPSGATSTSISPRECLLNAMGLRQSKTARLPEAEKISRKDRHGCPLPPEDAIERAVAKVREFANHRLVVMPRSESVSAQANWDAFPELARIED